MTRLPESLRAWNTDAFARSLKAELEGMNLEDLPLDAGTSHGGFIGEDPITATLLNYSDEGRSILADVGVFFTEILAGCSCGDEPESIHAYCRMRLRIDKSTAEAKIRVIQD
jgi:hypothetical protein